MNRWKEIPIIVHAQPKFSYTRAEKIENIRPYSQVPDAINIYFPGVPLLFETKRHIGSNDEGNFNPQNLDRMLGEEPDSTELILVGGEYAYCASEVFHTISEWVKYRGHDDKIRVKIPLDAMFTKKNGGNEFVTLEDLHMDELVLSTLSKYVCDRTIGTSVSKQASLSENDVTFRFDRQSRLIMPDGKIKG